MYLHIFHKSKSYFFYLEFQIKLKKEEAFARLNLAKINQQWRKLLREAKCKELQQDIEVSMQFYNLLIFLCIH